MQNSILTEAEIFVTVIFNQYCDGSFFFHNLEHTRNVVMRTGEMACYFQLPEEETIIVLLAAWFHDTGYLFTNPQIHEEKSVEILCDFLKDKSVTDEFMKKITDCVLATKFPTKPTNLLQSIVCDADTFHLGTDDFIHFNNKVCNEFKQRNILDNDEEFFQKTVGLMHIHRYHTSFGEDFLETKKKENIKALIQRHSS